MRPFRKATVQSNSGLRQCYECEHVSVKFGSFQYIAHVITAAVLQIAAENLTSQKHVTQVVLFAQKQKCHGVKFRLGLFVY